MGCNVFHLFKILLFDNLENDLGNAYNTMFSRKIRIQYYVASSNFIELMCVVRLEGKTHFFWVINDLGIKSGKRKC